MTDDLLAHASARSPRAALEELSMRARRAAERGRERPEVTIHLASGAVISGRLVKVDDDRGAAVALVHVGGVPAAPRVASLRVDQVVAVIHDLAPELDDLGPAPGRLEVMRAWGTHAAPLAAALGRGLELVVDDRLDESGRRAAFAHAPALGALLRDLAGDPLGRDALLAFETIRLGATPGGEIRKDARVLVIDVPDDPDRAWSPAALRHEVEQAL